MGYMRKRASFDLAVLINIHGNRDTTLQALLYNG
jgi:hypothetical protein